MRVIILIVAIFLIYGCSKRDNIKPESELFIFPKIDNVNSKYLFSKEEHAVQLSVGGTAYLQYIDNKLSKRIGGSLSIPGGSFYTTEIYDTVKYNTSKSITITSKDNSPAFNVYPNIREITVENGLVTKKITYDEVTIQHDTDTMYYFYNAEKMLKKTEQYFKFNIITKEYFFDNKNNLQRIATVKKSRDNSFVYYTAEELFGGYDNKANPLKGQTLWQDLLYRTLSKNNFTTYSYTSGTNTETRNWRLIYDNNGNVDYSR